MTQPSDIVTTLLTKSREGKIDWEEASDNSYYVEVGDLTMTVANTKVPSPSPLPGSIWRPTLTIRNASGNTIARVQNSEKDNVAELLELARRKALKIDEALQTLKDALDEL
jgi:hypothetical protein